MSQFGRYQIDGTPNGSWLTVEFYDRNGDFWLPVTTVNGAPVGHLFFRRLVEGVFELDQLRPVSCPMRNLSGVCKQPLCPQSDKGD
jgi:hypothetical protein